MESRSEERGEVVPARKDNLDLDKRPAMEAWSLVLVRSSSGSALPLTRLSASLDMSKLSSHQTYASTACSRSESLFRYSLICDKSSCISFSFHNLSKSEF